MSKKKKILIACGATVVLALIVFFSIRATRKDRVQVQTAKVERREHATSPSPQSWKTKTAATIRSRCKSAA